MRHYQISILLFGLVLPLLVAGGVFAASFIVRGKLADEFAEKTQQYNQLQQNRKALAELQAASGREMENLERWSSQTSQEMPATVRTTMRKIEELLPDREFTLTSSESPAGAAGFGTVASHSSSQIRLSFRGNFRSVQRAFLELETRIPQLQLHELRIAPNPNQPSMHNVQVAYSVWEK